MRPYELLEHRLADWAGYRPEQVVVCSSGTAALHLSLECLRLPPGAEVLVPDLTMIACARSATLAGLTPVFVDCGDDLLIDADLAEASYRQRTALAIMAVHVYGRRCAMSRLATIADAYQDAFGDVKVIEDLAEAHGVLSHPRTDAACWSFHRSKVVHGEEGGAVAFRDPAHATLARSLRDMGFGPGRDYVHAPGGWNHRLADLLAEPILHSLGQFDASVARRRQVETWYDAACPDEWRMPPRQSPWCFDVRCPGMTALQQDSVVRALHEAGILGARFGFKPLSSQEEYRDCRVVGGGNAARLASEIVYLPLAGPGLGVPPDAAAARHVFDVIRRALE